MKISDLKCIRCQHTLAISYSDPMIIGNTIHVECPTCGLPYQIEVVVDTLRYMDDGISEWIRLK